MVSYMSRINISLMIVLKNEVKEHLLFLLLISSLSNFQIDFAFDSFPSNFCYCNMTLSTANGMGQFVFIVVHDMKLCLITVKRLYIYFFFLTDLRIPLVIKGLLEVIFLLRFSQTCVFWSSKANWRLRFSLPTIILSELLGNKTWL